VLMRGIAELDEGGPRARPKDEKGSWRACKLLQSKFGVLRRSSATLRELGRRLGELANDA